MTNADIFHKQTTEDGGRCPRERLPDGARSVFDYVAERAENLIDAAREVLPHLPPVHFDFIMNADINAVAFKSDDRYFIGLNTGTVVMLRIVIGRMLSDARLFQHVGDPKLEDASLKTLPYYSPNADEMLKTGLPLIPRDAVRGHYAHYIQDQAIMFLVGHELTHIVHGHVGYIEAKQGKGFIAELGWRGGRYEPPAMERQCLEMDADRRSVWSRVDSLRVEFQKQPRRVIPWAEYGDDPSQMISDWAVSINILFRLFGDPRFSKEDLATSSYPPLLLRRVMCDLVAVMAIEQLWDPRLFDVGKKAMVAGRNLAENGFAKILGEKLDTKKLTRAAEISGDHMSRLYDYWNKTLVEQVRPYSYAF